MSHVFTIRIPAKSSLEPARFFHLECSPVGFPTGERPGKSFSPAFPKPLYTPGTGDRPPRSPPGTGEDRGSPVYISGRVIGARGSRPLGEQLDEANEVRAEVASEMRALEDVLLPANAAADTTIEAIRATHGEGRPVRLDRSAGGIVERRRLFAHLDGIAAKFGPMRGERRQLQSRLKAIDREIDILKRNMGAPRGKSPKRYARGSYAGVERIGMDWG